MAFRSLYDNFTPPHDINMLGFALGVAGVIFHTYTGYGMDKVSLRLCQWGLGVFAVAAPLDAINHTINGLDITTWAPAHFLLYAGTGIWAVGVCRGAVRALPPGRLRGFITSAFCFFFFENLVFPNGQQEYGIVEIQNWYAHTPEALPSTLAFAARQFGRPVDNYTVEHFSLPIPSWFYPVYGVLAAGLMLILAREVLGTRWAATRLVASYVAYRAVSWQILAWIGFTKSAVPFWLLAVGFGVDVAGMLALPALARIVAGSALITTLGYGALAVQSTWLAPPVSYYSAPATFVVFAAAWYAAQRWGPRYHRRLVDLLDHGRTAPPQPEVHSPA